MLLLGLSPGDERAIYAQIADRVGLANATGLGNKVVLFGARTGGDGVILDVDDIHTYYGTIHALKGISLEVSEGEIVTLIGANGAGSCPWA